jgi:hypothetical protein
MGRSKLDKSEFWHAAFDKAQLKKRNYLIIKAKTHFAYYKRRTATRKASVTYSASEGTPL